MRSGTASRNPAEQKRDRLQRSQLISLFMLQVTLCPGKGSQSHQNEPYTRSM